MARNCFTKLKAANILAALSDGRPPFLALAAERCGVNRNTLQTWLHKAERNPDASQDLVDFATSVRRIRAEYMVALADTINLGDKEARQKQFILQRLDADIFDPPKRTLVHEKPAAPETPEQPTPAELAEAVETLEKPETLQ